jgi:hypothetical protein
MDGPPTERVCYLAAAAVGTETDDTNPMWDKIEGGGCGQRADTDYNETWAPVAKLVTLRIFLSRVAILQLFTLQMDIKTAFLNADIEETVFVKPLYDHIFILKLLNESLSDAASRTKVADQIRAFLSSSVALPPSPPPSLPPRVNRDASIGVSNLG